MKNPHNSSNIQSQDNLDSHLNNTSYKINFSRFNQHIADISLSFTAKIDKSVVWLPSWLAGSYLMREFARHITSVRYSVGNSEYRADKASKNEWRLDHVKKGDSVSVTYEVYCYDLSVRTAYVDSQRIFGNFSSLALAVAGQESNLVTVDLCIPTVFYQDKNKSEVKIACGLPHTERKEDVPNNNLTVFSLRANSYDDLIDYPFEIAEQTAFGFITKDGQGNNIPHRFFVSGHISGRHAMNVNRLSQDVQKICQTYNTWLDNTPFDDYTFMTFASGNDYGGLEHVNSTALVIPRDDLPSDTERDEPSDSYQRYLGLCSHEYFHAWWVKTVRPDVMIGTDFRTEAYTPLLWVFEGFTSYIDDYMLQASGVVSQASYLKLLTAQIDRYNQTAGRTLQSLAESSFDAWIKLYRADENTGNAGISYYNKGALVSLCLDLLMLEQTDGKYRLFDVIKVFYQRAKDNELAGGTKHYGMTNDNLAEVMGEFINPKIWQDFYNRYVIGLESLPVNELLAKNGIKVYTHSVDNTGNQQAWGMVITESSNSNGLVISKINRDSVASEAGLSAKDEIMAIDGIKATKKQLANVANNQMKNGNTIICHAFRRDELMTFIVPAESNNNQKASAVASLDKISLSISSMERANDWFDGLNRY